MLEQLTEHLTAAERDRDVRCVVITGAGKGFCSGLDLQDAAAGTGIGGAAAAATAAAGSATPATCRPSCSTRWTRRCIAAINGAAAGYGLDLALGCDLRLLAASAKLLPGFAKRGVVPESGGTWYLPRLVGWAKACEIGFLGRDLDAAEAERLGLVNLVVPDDELAATARSWAERDRRQRPARRAVDEAALPPRPHRGLLQPHPPRAAPGHAAVRHQGLRRGHGELVREAPARVQGPLAPGQPPRRRRRRPTRRWPVT